MMLTSNRGNFSPTFFFTFVAAYYKYITFNEFFSRGSLKVILNPENNDDDSSLQGRYT
jgi:hypothetical protein